MSQRERIKEVLIYGAGYVGLSNAIALSQQNKISLYDKNIQIINNLKNNIVNIDDVDIQNKIQNFNIIFLDNIIEIEKYDLFILALPTNFNEKTKELDTSCLDDQIKEIRKYSDSTILIKSTVPIGYTDFMLNKYKKVIFSPEFLREGTSLYDVQHPSRIIFGWNEEIEWIKNMFINSTLNNPQFFSLKSKEAESVKLFSNSYLAARVAFVNEVDSFAQVNELNSKKLVEAISADPRIGTHYFRPSSGYGGYCLPKDTKQLISEFKKVGLTSSVIEGVDKSNEERLVNLVEIAKFKNKTITIEGIGHKPNVNNYRNSRNLKLAQAYKKAGIKVEVRDKSYKGKIIEGIKIT